MKDKELQCSNCNQYTTYDKALKGTINLTDTYTKDIVCCPNCLAHSVLQDIS